MKVQIIEIWTMEGALYIITADRSDRGSVTSSGLKIFMMTNTNSMCSHSEQKLLLFTSFCIIGERVKERVWLNSHNRLVLAQSAAYRA